ncbi:hypothetical protein Tco_0508407 [Tanacetum coccineum]
MLRESNILDLRNTLDALQNTVNAQAAHYETLANSYRSLACNVGPRDNLSLPLQGVCQCQHLQSPIPKRKAEEEKEIPPRTEVGGSSYMSPRVDKGKVANEVVNKAEVQIKGSKDFLKHQDAHLKLPEGFAFIKNLVIEELEHGLFFIYAFGKPTFQITYDIHEVDTETLLGYKVMASDVKTAANQSFSVMMSKRIDERPDKEKIMTKRVKLKNLGYTNE